MSLVDHLCRMPRAFDPDHGAEARALAPWAQGRMAELIAGAGGSSPYLRGLLSRESAWLEGAVETPEAAYAAIVDAAQTLSPDEIAGGLRQAKRRAALLLALADLAGVWPLEEVTGKLTRFADAAVDAALKAAIGREIARGKIPGQTASDIADAAGMCVLAMGKMGAFELNYSSDIDLICLFDETRFDRADYAEARAGFVRATRAMAKTLSDLTAEGYVFRTDLRLRPDPSVTPVCIAMEAAERYYESVGRTWERAAYIKARAAAGDTGAGARFLDTLRPFVWRKHLDFAAIQDAHDMRLKIRTHKGLHGPITLPGHDLKLGRGGIREIEFFTQTRQIIAGGRDESLRPRDTIGGLGALAAAGWVPQDAAQALTDHYRHLREVEHRVQMVGDAQTHALPGSEAGFERLACLMGLSREQLERQLGDVLEDVQSRIEGFFHAGADAPAPQAPPETTPEISQRWHTYPALRSPRAVEIFERLQPEILSRLSKAARPDEALVAFDGFLAGLPAGVQLFSLFEANPQLIDLLVDIVSVSPDLGLYLARNAQVFDAVIAGEFFGPWPGKDALREALSAQLARAGDYESQLDAARRWQKEWHFGIGVHLLRGLTRPFEAAGAYSDLAEATLQALWPVVQAEFARKFGPPPGRGAAVLGMGSLGAGRLHARSDLDVIVIYDPEDVEMSDGPRPLPSRSYYARLTQALVTALSAPMAEGRLYEVDMRLRPSGKKGPVATSWRAFQTYQREDAWLWEHLALTRARVVAGPGALSADISAFRAALLAQPRPLAPLLAEIAAMRARIMQAKGAGAALDPKQGRGRMQEIELLAQGVSLAHKETPLGTSEALEAAAAEGWLSQESARDLDAAYTFLSALQIGARLIREETLSDADLGTGAARFLAQTTDSANLDALQALFDQLTETAGAHIDRVLAGDDSDEG